VVGHFGGFQHAFLSNHGLASVSTPRDAAESRRPSPDAAYARWLAACANAGWRGQPVAEQVPVRDALARVAAAPLHACRPGSRLASEPLDSQDEELSPGEDLQPGELLIPAGHRLRPADLAAAAAAGHITLAVARPPVVAIIPTGDEIRPIGAALGPADLIDTNSLMLALLAQEIGARAVVSDIQRDDLDAIAAEIRRTACTADLVLLIAGSSAGRSDYAADAIAGAGGLAVRGVAVRPGHPALLGHARPGLGHAGQATPGRDRPGQAVPVIGIPGYPLSAVVIFFLFAQPLLTALQGWRPPEPRCVPAELACDWASPPDAEDWVPVTLAPAPAGEQADGTLLATPGRRGAGSISKLMRAHAWWRIPIGQAKFDRGELIAVRPIPGALPATRAARPAS
jgi:putative molybdopterin biosynthesis protein